MNKTAQHNESCPKCNATFTRSTGNITQCVCNAVPIASGNQFPTTSSMLIEGLHYYVENGNWVFTELYHKLRGYCCKSGCRHCVYGHGQ